MTTYTKSIAQSSTAMSDQMYKRFEYDTLYSIHALR